MEKKDPTTGPWAFSAGGKIVSQPLVDNEIAYFGSEDCCLYAVEIRTALEKWKFVTRGKIVSTPALRNGTLYFGNHDHFFYAVEAKTGGKKWKFAAERPITSSPAVAQDLILFGSWDGNLYALDAETGAEKWRIQTGVKISAAPAISNDLVFFSNHRGDIFAASISDGAIKYSLDSKKASSALVSANDLVLFGSGTEIVAIQASTGRIVWTSPAYDRTISPVVMSDGIAVFGAENHLYALDASTGKQEWELMTGSSPKESPVIANGIIYFVTRDNSFFGVDLKTGDILHSFDLGRSPFSQPAVTREWIIMGSADHNLYGYQFKSRKNDATGIRSLTGMPVPADEAPYPVLSGLVGPYSNAQQPWRLFLLAFLFPLYQYYWFYRNWKHLKIEHSANIRPWLRTLGIWIPFLNLFLAYGQFKRLRNSARAENIKDFSLALVAGGFLLLFVLPDFWSTLRYTFLTQFLIPETGWAYLLYVLFYNVASAGTVLILMIVQRSINNVWGKNHPSHPPRDFFTHGERFLIVIGVLGLIFEIAQVIMHFS